MKDERSSDSVRSLERGLRLLQAMNRRPQASVTQLAAEVGVPRSTAYRMLDTLSSMGFVSTASGRYTLAHGVRTLSDGFIDETWTCLAWVEMVRLSKELVWPISLSTPDVATMVIRRTTHELSAMSIDYGMVGRRLPMMETSAGRTYLAFCPEEERRLILSLQGPCGAEGHIDREILEKRLERIRQQGFDTRIGGYVAKTGSLAVPLIVGERVLGCMAIIFIAAGLTLEQAVARFEGPLKQAGQSICDAVTGRNDQQNLESVDL